ncbi:hypothetical protein ACFVHB_09410 [Kitasatospora sp. NPDC127111]|uniref:hypothetical protein n=1 Tax=Kitasatospora sp. NPDC127111 TaxID=3345363 RepID=UPI00363865E1
MITSDSRMALNSLSVRLGAVGRREEGLVAVQEAAGHYRVLAKLSRAMARSGKEASGLAFARTR